MTIHLRLTDAPAVADLGGDLGACRVGLATIVATWGSGPVAEVVYLGDWCEEGEG